MTTGTTMQKISSGLLYWNCRGSEAATLSLGVSCSDPERSDAALSPTAAAPVVVVPADVVPTGPVDVPSRLSARFLRWNTTLHRISPQTIAPTPSAAMTTQVQNVRIWCASSVIPSGQPKYRPLGTSHPVTVIATSATSAATLAALAGRTTRLTDPPVSCWETRTLGIQARNVAAYSWSLSRRTPTIGQGKA